MANYKPIGVPFDRTFRNDLNENFKALDGVASSAKADTQVAKQAATSAAQSAQQAHLASEEAVTKATTTQAQLDDIILENGQSEAEVVQARGGETLLYKRLDKIDTLSTELANTIDEKFSITQNVLGVTVEQFGALGDGTNQQTAIQSAINYVSSNLTGITSGGVVRFGDGVYLADTITLKSGVSLIGTGKTVIRKVNDADGATTSPLLDGVNTSGVELRKINVQHQSSGSANSPLVRFLSNAGNTVSNITIAESTFTDVGNGRNNLVTFQGLMSAVAVDRSKFSGSSASISTYLSSLLYIDNAGLANTDLSSVTVTFCEFLGGKRGVSVEGSGTAPNFYFYNNKVTGQTVRGLSIYHGNRWRVENNEFSDITAKAASNNDGGAVWLDMMAPSVGARGCTFSNNTVTNIVGNAVLLEEFTGIITGNEITNVSRRTGDTFTTSYTYEGTTTTLTSNGGHAIHVTGGCENFLIEGNKMRGVAGAGINLDRGMGIQKTYDIKGTIRGNKIQSTDNGIEILERITEVDVIGNEIVATNAAIKVDRKHTTSNNVLGKLFANGNTCKANSGIVKTYSYGYGYLVGNTIERDPAGTALTWANNQGYTAGNININKSDKSVLVF